MEVITSHTNADFDTFASMVAAKKLYPEAALVFSGSLEKSLRDALAGMTLPYAFLKAKDIDIGNVTRLILVDSRQASRIGPFSAAALRAGVDIHIYDHHPATADDLKGSVEVIRPYGSTTTVLTLIIKEKGIGLTPEEATILMAGIYEDTGSLGYPSTTAEDYEAAAFLLSCGAALSTVTGYLKKELTPQEVSLLNEFLNSETKYTIDGVEITVAEGYLEKYVGDISILAHKMVDIEGLACLFMLVDSEDRVHVIARSRTPKVDVGRVARALGGGGHANAASATIKDMTLIEARERLLGELRKSVVPEKKAEDIMSFPPITLAPELPLKKAVEAMRRYNINAAPVLKGGLLAGVITRQVVDKAVYHGLGDAPVADCMTTECDTVGSDTSIDEIREKVIGHGTRLLPVLREKKVVGVITRTDLLKLLQEELRQTGARAQKARYLSKLMKESLPGWAYELLKSAGEEAERLGCKAYAVGGFVRDLLLRRENLDIDIVIEGGDGIAFAETFAAKRGIRVRPHHRFRTAVLIFPDGFKLDVATARLEYYEKPGALPTVEQSSLKLDLYRRDFIMNTLAVALNPPRFGELIDFFGAQKDIKESTIRVLHNLSFVEDPTRMLRAVRFSEKFGFRIGKHTLNLMKNSVKLDVFRHLSGARLFEELRNILKEDIAPKAIKRLNELGILRLIHEKLSWDIKRELFFEKSSEAVTWHELLYTRDKAEAWPVLFLALTDPLTEAELSSLTRRLMITGKKNLSIIESRAAGLSALKKIDSGAVKSNSDLYALLKPLPLEVVIYLIAKAGKEGTKKALSRYMTQLKYARVFLSGDDLKKMGMKEGPSIGAALQTLLKKRLNNELTTREEQEEFVKRELRPAKGKKAPGAQKKPPKKP